MRGEGRQPALSGFGRPAHLARRFAGSLRPGGPGVADDAWARHWLSGPEAGIWASMSGPDRRHAVVVARRVAASWGDADGAGVPRNVVASALLHDSGKVDARLGTLGRSAATLVAIVAGRERAVSWARRGTGWASRVGRYVTHDRIGSEMLREAGSDPLTVAWAREHHLPSSAWTVDSRIGAILKAADDD